MNNVIHLSDAKGKYTEACGWVSKLDRGLSSSEEEALHAWMAEHEENAELFLEVAKTWDKMSSLSRLSDLVREPSGKQVWRSRLAGAAMIVLAVATGVAGVRGLGPELSEPATQTIADRTALTTYETVIGEQSTVVLPDGSEFVLNTNSLLQVQYAAHHRTLTLVRGEVHVEVAPDAARPLSVLAGGNIVQAVGTAFGVEFSDTGNVQVVVTEGEVLIGARPAQINTIAQITTPVLPSSSLTVAQGQAIQLGAPGAKVAAVSLEDIEVRLSWRDGNLVFRGESLEEALNEVERYATVKFVFVDDSLKQQEIAGRFKAGDVEGLLAVLRENIGVAYERTDDGRIFLRRM